MSIQLVYKPVYCNRGDKMMDDKRNVGKIVTLACIALAGVAAAEPRPIQYL